LLSPQRLRVDVLVLEAYFLGYRHHILVTVGTTKGFASARHCGPADP
jgi:hypothetical protein